MTRLARIGSALVAAIAAASVPVAAGATPFGTTYVASVSNLPGSDSTTLEFDGLPEAVGSSGLVVSEASTTLGSIELIEFALSTADGNPFVGQQDDPLGLASVSVTGLHWFGDTTPAATDANSGFLYLTIDGVPQAMSDVLGQGLVFGTHPLNPSIQVLLIFNAAGTSFDFHTFGATAQDAFAALVGPTLAAQVDDIHFGVAAAPVPEPALLGLLALGLTTAVRRRGGLP